MTFPSANDIGFAGGWGYIAFIDYYFDTGAADTNDPWNENFELSMEYTISPQRWLKMYETYRNFSDYYDCYRYMDWEDGLEYDSLMEFQTTE